MNQQNNTNSIDVKFRVFIDRCHDGCFVPIIEVVDKNERILDKARGPC